MQQKGRHVPGGRRLQLLQHLPAWRDLQLGKRAADFRTKFLEIYYYYYHYYYYYSSRSRSSSSSRADFISTY